MLLFLACAQSPLPPAEAAPGTTTNPEAPAVIPTPGPKQAVAVFAGGCFWCLEADFDKLAGVIATTSGYAGGRVKNPSYAQVGGHGTGHLEVVHVIYDTTTLSYPQVLDYFWRHVDPVDVGGQFCDRGEPYFTGVFPVDAEQERIAMASKAALDASKVLAGPVFTKVYPVATPFYAAENYHQDFHVTTPGRYNSYRFGCGRDAKVAAIWGAK